jgi:hypothetical protein
MNGTDWTVAGVPFLQHDQLAIVASTSVAGASFVFPSFDGKVLNPLLSTDF